MQHLKGPEGLARGVARVALRLALALALIGGAGTLVRPASAQPEVTLVLHHPLSATSPTQTRTLEPWARRVAEASGGRVAIEIFPAMTLGGKPPELISQVRDGVVDLIWTVNGYTPGLFPRSEVMELPTVYANDPRAANLALADLRADLAPEYAGTEVMFLHVHAGNGLQMRNRAVRTPADLAGLRLRTPSRTGAWMIEALGATPVAMPVPDLPQALARGTVDGAFVPWEIIPSLKLQDQTDYQIEGDAMFRFGTIVFQLAMNKARWDSLPEEIRAAFRSASAPEWLGDLGDEWRVNDNEGLAVAVAAGNQHITLDPAQTEAFRAALAPVVDRWVAEAEASGIDARALVGKARDLIGRHSAR